MLSLLGATEAACAPLGGRASPPSWQLGGLGCGGGSGDTSAFIWCGLEWGASSLRHGKTVNRKSLESPSGKHPVLQGFRWKLVTEKDCVRRRCGVLPCEAWEALRAPSLCPLPPARLLLAHKPPRSSSFCSAPTSAASPDHRVQAGPRSGGRGHFRRPPGLQPRAGRQLSGKKGLLLGVWLPLWQAPLFPRSLLIQYGHLTGCWAAEGGLSLQAVEASQPFIHRLQRLKTEGFPNSSPRFTPSLHGRAITETGERKMKLPRRNFILMTPFIISFLIRKSSRMRHFCQLIGFSTSTRTIPAQRIRRVSAHQARISLQCPVSLENNADSRVQWKTLSWHHSWSQCWPKKLQNSSALKNCPTPVFPPRTGVGGNKTNPKLQCLFLNIFVSCTFCIFLL